MGIITDVRILSIIIIKKQGCSDFNLDPELIYYNQFTCTLTKALISSSEKELKSGIDIL